jgi:hypothetical protein
LCDGSRASFFGEELLYRCADAPILQPARLESEPRTSSPHRRCGQPTDAQAWTDVADCAENEFWHAFSDGREEPRTAALGYLGTAIDRLQAELASSSDVAVRLSRLHQLRGMLYMALGIENGESVFLIKPDDYAVSDFARVRELDPVGSVVADGFDAALALTNAIIEKDYEAAAALAREGIALGRGYEDPAIRTGYLFTISTTYSALPISTGVPADVLKFHEETGCVPGTMPGCEGNTLRAPYARPGLEYQLAELYARLGMSDAYVKQLDVVAAQPGYEDWAWRDFVEAQREEPTLLLEKFASWGNDEAVSGYAASSSACVFCHGRI